MTIYSNGEELKVGDRVRLVRKSDFKPNGGNVFWDTFHTITGISTFEIWIDGQNGRYDAVLRMRNLPHFVYMWEIERPIKDYKADQQADESEDLL